MFTKNVQGTMKLWYHFLDDTKLKINIRDRFLDLLKTLPVVSTAKLKIIFTKKSCPARKS